MFCPNDWLHFLVGFQKYCSRWLLSKFSFRTLEIDKSSAAFRFSLLITVLILMLTSLVCAGIINPGSSRLITGHRAPSARRRRGHETAQPQMQMRICCRACSPSASAASRRQPGDCHSAEPAVCLGQPSAWTGGWSVAG